MGGYLEQLTENPKETAKRAAVGVATGGLSEVDRATGNHVGNALKGAGDWIGANNPFKNLTPPKYDPNAVADVTAPKMPDGSSAAQVNANGLTGAKIAS